MRKFRENDRFTTTKLGKTAITAEQQDAIYDLALKEGKIMREERLVLRSFRGAPTDVEITGMLIEILIKVGIIKKV